MAGGGFFWVGGALNNLDAADVAMTQEGVEPVNDLTAAGHYQRRCGAGRLDIERSPVSSARNFNGAREFGKARPCDLLPVL